MIEIDSIANNLFLKEGIWFSKNQSSISYPEEGNDNYFLIEERSFWFKHRNACIEELVHKWSPNSSFFDIGGGNGFVSLALQRKGIDTILLEPGIRGIINGKKRGIHQLVCSTIQDAGFREESIPAAGLFDVIEHMENDVDLLKKIATHLVPNGKLYITVPAYTWLWSEEDVFAGHYRRYTCSSIKRALQKAGY